MTVPATTPAAAPDHRRPPRAERAPRPGRSAVRPGDALRTALTGLRYRRTRAALSALGIAIGIAALVAVLGITRSDRKSVCRERVLMPV